jgi:hypothetical protein
MEGPSAIEMDACKIDLCWFEATEEADPHHVT